MQIVEGVAQKAKERHAAFGEPYSLACMLCSPRVLQDLPVIDLALFLNAGSASEPAVQDACRAVADCLRETGALVVRDPRVSQADNSAFIDMMEEYFSQPHEAKMRDVRAELAYQARSHPRPRAPVTHTPPSPGQVGATPELVEVPRCKVRA